MDLVGHCVTSELSGVFTSEEIYKEKICSLMFLNFMHCHEWAYENCWFIDYKSQFKEDLLFFRAHMIGDWTIHYGLNQTEIKTKNGWAYKLMKPVKEKMQVFFMKAVEYDLIKSEFNPNVSLWSSREIVDFCHSIVEYSLDFVLSEKYLSDKKFMSVKDNLSKLSNKSGACSQEWANSLFEMLNIKSDRSKKFINESINRMGLDAKIARNVNDFAILTTIHKYGFKQNDDSKEYIYQFINSIINTYSKEKAFEMVELISNCIKNPEKIYTGNYLSKKNDHVFKR